MATLGELTVTLGAKTGPLNRALARAESQLKRFQATSQAVRRDFARVGRTLRPVGLIAVGIGGAAIKMASDFDTGVREIGTLLGGLTEHEIADMKSELQDLAVSSGQTIDTLMNARYNIISTGFADIADSAEILAVSAEAAVGTVSDVNTVASVVTQSLKAYNLEADDARKVTDILTTTVQKGRTTMDRLGASLGTVLATANTAKLSLEGLGAAIATATPVIGGSEETTTALNNALFSLVAPVDQAEKAMKQFHIEVKRLDDGSLDLVETMKQFQGLDLAAIRKIIPEKRSARIIQVLANDVGTLQDNLDAMNTAGGKTRQFFEDIASGAGFKLSQLLEQMKNQLRNLGTELLPSVATAVKNIGIAFKNNKETIQHFITQVGKIVSWVVQHGDLIGKLFVIGTITAVIGKLALFAAALNPVTAAIAGLAAVLGTVYVAAMKAAADQQAEFEAQLDRLSEGTSLTSAQMNELNQILGKQGPEAAKQYLKSLKNIEDLDLSDAGLGITIGGDSTGASEATQNAEQSVAALAASYQALVDIGLRPATAEWMLQETQLQNVRTQYRGVKFTLNDLTTTQQVLIGLTQRYADNLIQAGLAGEKMGDAVVRALESIATLLLKRAAVFALLSLFPGGSGILGGTGFLKYLFQPFAARAGGGPVSPQSSYIVGERGPEIFTPNTSGRIVPSQMRAENMNIVLEVDGQQLRTAIKRIERENQ